LKEIIVISLYNVNNEFCINFVDTVHERYWRHRVVPTSLWRWNWKSSRCTDKGKIL